MTSENFEYTGQFTKLKQDIESTVQDYRFVFPEPSALAPNLQLAVNALKMLETLFDPTLELQSTVTFTGNNRAEIIRLFEKHDIPMWVNAKEFGTDYGYHRDAETDLPLGEPAIGVGDVIVIQGNLASVFRLPH